MKRSFIREILEAIDEHTISFAGGLPSENLFPIEDLKIATNKILDTPKIYQYTVSNGIAELREQIAQRYTNEGFPTTKDNILITTGSQQAMYILAKFFENKEITIEEPSYLGAMNIFRLNNLKMQGVKLENDGVNIDEFEKSLKITKLSYLIPDFQNPSATTYSQDKRDAVVNIVKKHNALLIEDSPYSELFFNKKSKYISQDLPNNSFHLGSFSKTLVPSLRIGWIRADEEKIRSLMIIKESIDLHSSGISQYILAEYLKDTNKYEKHLQSIRDDYKAKADFFSEQLNILMPEFKHQKPKGGMFLYGGFEDKKIDTFALVQECLKKKVVYVPGNQFYIDKIPNAEIRFNYTHSSFEQITKGIKLIKSCL
ncbi:2-aminoadipate transaminase [Aliarcobacter thereius]|uniref:PLP-dependent aminotransferase family protein n=2 Tax=Aliarcobacter thereius TaxID=544718 RepID=A0A5R9H8R1_9BACT|nr:PLP-dependent aminotransferase family protein [Aliarcobacter thereius]OCL88676.1 2-aminoadipate transaminase [Aliarcobacter thereius]OCL92171.1 2-aminoadipate transaminase [Aliarcobacter thereius]OCL94733.1 2-aminoadipate transaminase [Aliarcobacter thereius LMG 24486]QBF15391.1 PLP-dependent aminotransferase [Aliarcobacter thereius LMG 24486]TLS72387.1 PLP-dependent aminotransferase family protein [Aliarcobacter thereius]